jgi:hypothetical protein
MNYLQHAPVSVRRLFCLVVSLGAVSQIWFIMYSSSGLYNPSEGILTTPSEDILTTPNLVAETVKDQVRKPKRSPRNVYWCGYGNLFNEFGANMGDHLFPESNVTKLLPGFVSDKDDVLLYPCGGDCPFKDHAQIPLEFKGKILSFNGESSPCLPSHHKNVFPVSAVDSKWKNSSGLQATFMAMHLMSLPQEWQNKIFRPEHHPRNINITKDRFLVYAVSSCRAHREYCFAALSNLGKQVEYAGKCSARWVSWRNKTNIVEAPDSIVKSNWGANHKEFQPYRFALVMENKRAKGYITEKIMNAFLAGCIPIYYGTEEIFDIFNKKAFIWYDIHSPERARAALNRIAYLEENRTAYDEVLKEPILADGEETIRKYFSFNDGLGNGDIKWFIRDLLGVG